MLLVIININFQIIQTKRDKKGQKATKRDKKGQKGTKRDKMRQNNNG